MIFIIIIIIIDLLSLTTMAFKPLAENDYTLFKENFSCVINKLQPIF